MIESLVPEGKSPEQDGQRESPGEPAEESARARNRDEGRFPVEARRQESQACGRQHGRQDHQRGD